MCSSDLAKEIGSVNTVVNRNGKLIGYNTDYSGLDYSLKRANISLTDKKVLILGSGGASKTCHSLAKNRGARLIRIVSRTGLYNYQNLDESKDFDIIINASPVGMYPNNLASLVDLNSFDKLEGVVDLIYNPLKTKLILDAEDLGIKYSNGLAMLVGQAYYSSNFFTGYKLPPYLIEDIIMKLEKQMSNIVLVGMPGCGKSCLGKILAKELNKKFIDTDEEIYKKSGLSAGEYIIENGEEAFRKLESEVIEIAGKETNSVIATGGGSIINPKNQLALRQNGFIIYLEREIGRASCRERV